MNRKQTAYAPLKMGVILPALLAVLLLAAGVCVLHGMNAVSLRGQADPNEYVQMEPTDGELALRSAFSDKAQEYMLYEDGEKRFGLDLADPWKDRGIVHIEGTLLRIGQTVGEIRVRVGLVVDQGTPETDEVILLNTQMVRRPYFVGENGYDDHCGFSAAVDADQLPEGDHQYCVVLVDETDGAKRMFQTGMTLKPIEGGIAFGRVNQPESEEAHAQ